MPVFVDGDCRRLVAPIGIGQEGRLEADAERQTLRHIGMGHQGHGQIAEGQLMAAQGFGGLTAIGEGDVVEAFALLLIEESERAGQQMVDLILHVNTGHEAGFIFRVDYCVQSLSV